MSSDHVATEVCAQTEMGGGPLYQNTFVTPWWTDSGHDVNWMEDPFVRTLFLCDAMVDRFWS